MIKVLGEKNQSASWRSIICPSSPYKYTFNGGDQKSHQTTSLNWQNSEYCVSIGQILALATNLVRIKIGTNNAKNNCNNWTKGNHEVLFWSWSWFTSPWININSPLETNKRMFKFLTKTLLFLNLKDSGNNAMPSTSQLSDTSIAGDCHCSVRNWLNTGWSSSAEVVRPIRYSKYCVKRVVNWRI